MFSRRILLASTALTTSLWWANAGLAAGPSGYDWTGAYAGAGFTALSGTHTGTLDLLLPTSISNYPINLEFNGPTPAPRGVGATGLAEYDVQFDQFVLGLEGSLTIGAVSGATTFNTGTTVSVGTSVVIDYGPNSIGITTLFSTSWSTYTHTTYGDTEVVGGTTFTSSTIWTDTTTYEGTGTTVGLDGSTTYTPLTTSHSAEVSVGTDTVYGDPTSTGQHTDTQYGGAQVTVVGRASIDWLSEIKGKVGFAQDRTLFYLVGGLAVGGVSQSVSGTYTNDADPGGNGTFTGSQSSIRVGGVIGAGIQQALDDHWVLQGEADYFNLGTAQYTGTNPSVTMTQVIDGIQVTGGMLYKFN